MKKLLLALLLVGFAVFAQSTVGQQDEMVVIKKSDLTADQKAKVQMQETAAQLGQYKEYAEMGRGVGLAIGETLRGVKDVAVDFSKTDVGKFAMFLIAWKIMAKDIMSMGDTVFGYLVGIPLLFIGGVVLVWSYRKQCFPRRVLIENSKEKGKRWAIVAPNGQVFQVNFGTEREPDVLKMEGQSSWAWGHVICGVVWILICSIMIFSG